MKILGLALMVALAGEWSPETKLTLAHVLVGEADWSAPDHAGISWVLLKRWQMRHRTRPTETFASFMRKYSKPMVSRQSRGKAVRQLPWGDPITPAYRHYTSRWRRVREFVERWATGRVKDPCPTALHWGGTMDRAPVQRTHVVWHPVECGPTRNIFYAPVYRARGGKQ